VKAINLVRKAVAKVAKVVPLQTGSIPITKRALVVGGGIAGIFAALDIADHGHEGEIWVVWDALRRDLKMWNKEPLPTGLTLISSSKT